MMQARWLMTAGVNAKIAEDTEFAKLVTEAMGRFNANDWGTVDSEDSAMNDQAAKDLAEG